MITLELLQGMFPKTKTTVLETYIDPLNEVCDKFEINTSERLAMFLAQVGHESGGLSVVQENLNYRAERLAVVFPKYFKGIVTSDYAHIQKRLPIESMLIGWAMGMKNLVMVISSAGVD